MKKLFMFMTIVLLLTSCSTSNERFKEKISENVENSYGLIISSVNIEDNKVYITTNNILEILQSLEKKSDQMGLDSQSIFVSLFENINNEIKLLNDDLMLGTVTDGTNEFVLNGYDYKSIYWNNEVFARDKITYEAYKKMSRENALKSEKDYYDMFDGDEEWESVVDSLFEIYEGVNEWSKKV